MHSKLQPLRHVALVLLVAATALFQNVFIPAVKGVPEAYYLIALTGAVAMFENELTSAAYGILAGVLWDIASPLPDGVVTLFFTVYACAGCLLAHYLFRRTVLTAAVITAAGSALYAGLHLICAVLPHDASGLGSVWLRSFLPCFLFTLLTAPLYYAAVRALEKKFGAKIGIPT